MNPEIRYLATPNLAFPLLVSKRLLCLQERLCSCPAACFPGDGSIKCFSQVLLNGKLVASLPHGSPWAWSGDKVSLLCWQLNNEHLPNDGRHQKGHFFDHYLHWILPIFWEEYTNKLISYTKWCVYNISINISPFPVATSVLRRP